MRIVVTGGAGFIGSHICDDLLARGENVLCIDDLTYAGSEGNLTLLRSHPNFTFVRGDIADTSVVQSALEAAEALINCAAETHVDRSLLTPARFARTDVYGVAVLLDVARAQGVGTIVQVSTDEVYGEVNVGESTEESALRPRSPYAASKAGGDLLAQAFAHTYGMDIRITRGCNAFGPRQHPEKFMPLMITNALLGQALPLYGDGEQEREWLAVGDHASAILTVLDRGTAGGVYNIGSGERSRNVDVARAILRECGRDESLIKFVEDRPGHDRRYAVSADRLRGLGWRPMNTFPEALRLTAAWYRANERWWQELRAASRDYFERMYERRAETLRPLVRGGK